MCGIRGCVVVVVGVGVGVVGAVVVALVLLLLFIFLFKMLIQDVGLYLTLGRRTAWDHLTRAVRVSGFPPFLCDGMTRSMTAPVGVLLPPQHGKMNELN